jgi:hypothetical protein
MQPPVPPMQPPGHPDASTGMPRAQTQPGPIVPPKKKRFGWAPLAAKIGLAVGGALGSAINETNGTASPTATHQRFACTRTVSVPCLPRHTRVRRFSGVLMIKKLAGTFVAAGALLLFAAPAAHAAAPMPFTITESIDNNAGEFSFTATGLGLCQSGTFEDDVHAVGAGNAPIPKVNVLIRTVYTCDNGDTFFAQKHVFLAFNEDGSFTNTGPITLQGGTGAFTRLSGHGVDNGTGTADGTAVGEISGVLKLV